jgi:hypothetical protein
MQDKTAQGAEIYVADSLVAHADGPLGFDVSEAGA